MGFNLARHYCTREKLDNSLKFAKVFPCHSFALYGMLLYMCVSVSVSVYMSVCLSVFECLCLYVCLCVYACVSVSHCSVYTSSYLCAG